MGARHLATVLDKHVDDATQRKIGQAKADAERTFVRNPEILIKLALEVEHMHGNWLVQRRTRVLGISKSLSEHEDEGMSL